MTLYVSVIILTKNAGSRFKNVLEALFNGKTDFGFEVIVVDSGSTDSTNTITRDFPVKLIEIHPSSFGHGKTRNLAAGHSKGEVLAFLTQDAVPAGELWLSSLVKHFRDKKVSGVYGRQLPNADSTPLEKFFLDYLYPDKPVVKESIDAADCLLSDMFFSNVNSAVRRSDWQDNMFNENLIMSEDQDWAKRMLQKGRKIIYEPEAAVYHSHSYSIPAIISRNFDSGMSLRGLVNAPAARGLRYEWRYLMSGFGFFAEKKLYRYMLIFPIYECARALGFLLGFYSRFLPRPLRIWLSQNKVFWERA
ncbi:MAG: glycosyltransferase [Candidatus Omnitrophota bacterium]